MLTYGLLIEATNRYGTTYVEARVVCRENSDDFPRGCSSNPWGEDYDAPKNFHGLYLDGLTMRGFHSDLNRVFIGYEPKYCDMHSVNANKANRMAKTLKRIDAAIAKAEAHSPEDVFLALAKALKLSFVVEKNPNKPSFGSSYSDNQWYWMSVASGRNRYRRLIEETRPEQKTA